MADPVAGSSRARRVLASLAAVFLVFLASCSGKPKYEPGCYLNDSVKGPTRRELEQEADRFFGLLRARHYEDAWSEASGALRNRVPKTEVAQAWTSIAEILTIPEELTTREIAVAVFPEGTRGPQELSCTDPSDPTGARRIMVTDQPFQAYLIQSAVVSGTTYNFASIWFHEDGRWKLATFGAKPRVQLGHDWQHWLTEARTQKEKGNEKNAALLYNMAMDLLVPAPWVRPALLDTLQKEQRRIRTDNLPAGRRLRWVASDSTVFHPYMVSYEVTEQGLAVKFQYEVPEPVDTTQVARQAPSLAGFVRTTFPEYSEVFSSIILEGTTPVEHQPVWTGSFSFR